MLAAVVACLALLVARYLVRHRCGADLGHPVRPPLALLVPAALLAVGIAISCIMGPAARIQELGRPVSHLFLLWLGWWLADDCRFLGRFSLAATAAAGAAGGYALMQLGGLDPLPALERFPARILSTFENPNHFGSFVAAALTLSMGGFLGAALRIGGSDRGLRSLVWWYLAVGLTYAGLLLSASRGGWWAFLCGLTILTGGLASCWRRARARWRWRPLLVMALLLAGITGLLSTAPIMPGPTGPITLTDRVMSSAAIVDAGGPGDSTLNHRYFLWQVAGEMIRQHPLVGSGYGSFQRQYPAVRARLSHGARFAALNPGQQQEVPRHAHNEYLHLWAESGVLAVGGLVLLLAMGGLSGLSQVRRDPDAALPMWTAMAALLTFTIHGAVSYPLHMPLSTTVFWLLLGIIFKDKRTSYLADSRP